jgi:hypothetical protein
MAANAIPTPELKAVKKKTADVSEGERESKPRAQRERTDCQGAARGVRRTRRIPWDDAGLEPDSS